MPNATKTPPDWTCVQELDANRHPVTGSDRAVSEAVARGADLRVYTEWRFEEHVAPDLNRPAETDECGLMQEVIDFRQTIFVEPSYAVGVTTLRQAILPIAGFNPQGVPRMSFFMYDVQGRQRCANVLLDDNAAPAEAGNVRIMPMRDDMPLMSEVELHDENTKAPSTNFIYRMERYRYFVRDDWREVLAHDATGEVASGSFEALHTAHHAGCDLKVAIRNLAGGDTHEIISPVGTSWVHTTRAALESLTHPLVRVRGATPLKYSSGNWDVAWIFVSTTGKATVRRLDPYRRVFVDEATQLACRWFAR